MRTQKFLLFRRLNFSSLCTEKPTFLPIAHLLNENKEIDDLGTEFTSFMRTNVKQKLKKMHELHKSHKSLEQLLSNESDAEMKDLYGQEILELKSEVDNFNDQIIKSYFDHINEGIEEVTIEIRAGSGGAEAALFAGELLDLYKLYFDSKNWKFKIISESCVGAHMREAIIVVDGCCFAELSSEMGIHRVQRVPETESQGRIHTSTVSVAVIPQKSNPENILNEKDVRMDVYRSSGPGGQNVNKTNSAVRLVHIPTGVTVCMQDERSQVENRIRAFKVLKLRLEERNKNLEQLKTKSIRTEQIGSSERSEKIRTYNFPQNRITDHRFSWSSQNLSNFFEEPSVLSELIERFQYYHLNTLINKHLESLK